jgi:hypothetical protein
MFGVRYCPKCFEIKAWGVIFGFIFAVLLFGLVWKLPKFIYKKTGIIGLAIYIAVLVAAGAAGYYAINSKAGELKVESAMAEVTPAASTWSKMLEAYIMGKNTVGDCKAIGYQLRQSEYFSYECGVRKSPKFSTAFFYIKNKNTISNCLAGSTLKIEFNTIKGTFDVFAPPATTCPSLESAAGKVKLDVSRVKYQKLKP